MSDKLTKFLAVIFLTLLVWTWAFLKQEDEKTFIGSLEVSSASDPSLLVSFVVNGKDWGRKVPLQLNFKGVPAKINELSLRIERASPEDRERLSYQYDPRVYGHTETKTYSFDLLNSLQKNNKTKDLALTLESCFVNQEDAAQIEVKIEVLQKKQLPVECIGENGRLINGAIAEPAWVEMYVQENYNKAYVTLSAQQIDLARQQQLVSVKPYVEMGANVIRHALQEVTVKITKETFALQPRVLQPFQKPRSIGYIFSDNLLGKYTVQMDSESESKLRTINFRASDEAYTAYEKMRYPILIEIRDEDANLTEGIPPREIIYNFPPEYVAKREIELGDPLPPKTAIIRLIPITPSPTNQ